MADSNSKLTAAEWHVMKLLWEQGPMTVTQLAHALAASVGWAKSTAVTTVTRMEAKGLVSARQEGRAKHYYPNLRREDAAQSETRSFLERVYNGSVGMMVSAMVQQETLSRAEIDELYEILRRAEEGAS